MREAASINEFVEETAEAEAVFEPLVSFFLNVLWDSFDIERLFFFLYCGNKRKLEKAGKQIQWLVLVTAPFYISVLTLAALVSSSFENSGAPE